MQASPEQATERVVFETSVRSYVRLNLGIFCGFALFYMLFMFASGGLVDLLIGYTRPVDVWDLALQPAVMLGFGVPAVLLTAWLMARKRRYTVLSPYGVDYPPQGIGGGRGQVPWPAVTGVDVVRAGFLSLVCLRLVDGRKLRIAPPYGFRRRGAELVAALEQFRGYAQRFGGRTDAPVRSGRAVFATVALVVFGLLALLGLVRLATVPVIAPWAPYASALPEPCEALERAGLERHWPAAQRASQAEPPQRFRGEKRECDVTTSPEFDGDSRFSGVTLSVERFDAAVLSTAAKRAYEDVAGAGRYQDGAVPVELGDVAYRWESYDSAVALAVCRGNAVVRVEVDSEGGQAENARVARELAEGVLDQLRFD